MALTDGGGEKPRPPPPVNPFLVIIGVGTLVMMPALLAGAMRNGIDSIFHARWMQAFATQVWSGELYPRWLLDLNGGFGSPAFFIYPPFSQYVSALLHPLLPDPNSVAFLLGVSAWLAIVISGLACLLWLRHALPQWSAAVLIGALTYMLAPYHLYVDVYQRGALAEIWAFVWPPLSLLQLHRLDRFQPRAMVWLCLSLAGLLVTHAPSVLILFPAYFLYALLLDLQDRRLARTAWLVASCAIACLLAGWYLATALLHTRYIDMSALFGARATSSNWLIGGGAWHDPAIQRDIYVSVAIQGVIGLACAAIALANSSRKHVALPLAAILLSIISLFMMSVLSKTIWDLGLPINRIQFPWRFALLLSLACALAAALVVASFPGVTRMAIALPVLLLLANALLYAFPAEYPVALTSTQPTAPDDPSWDAREYRLASRKEVETAFAAGERARVTNGIGSVNVIEWRPRALKLDVEATTQSVIAIRQFRYPGWTAEGGASLIESKPYLQIAVPSGHHTIELILSETPEETAGRIASGIGLLILLAIAAMGFLRRLSPRSGEPRIPA
jgi:hypothetical protein